jgi:hypothetical protein
MEKNVAKLTRIREKMSSGGTGAEGRFAAYLCLGVPLVQFSCHRTVNKKCKRLNWPRKACMGILGQVNARKASKKGAVLDCFMERWFRVSPDHEIRRQKAR